MINKKVLLLALLGLSSACLAKEQSNAQFGNLADAFSLCERAAFNLRIKEDPYVVPAKSPEALPKCLKTPLIRNLTLKTETEFMNPWIGRSEDSYKKGEHKPTSSQRDAASGPNRPARPNIYASTSPAFTTTPASTLFKKYFSYDPIRICKDLWYSLDETDAGAKALFDPSGRYQTFLITIPTSCYWGWANGGKKFSGKVPDESELQDIWVDTELSPFWIVQIDKKNKARVIYYDEAAFVKIIRPKGARSGDYPVLAYGGRSINKVPWFQQFLKKQGETYSPSDIVNSPGKQKKSFEAIFFSYFDHKKQKLVEGGANYVENWSDLKRLIGKLK